MDLDVISIVRMVVAVLCGAAIGLNRDMHGKPTGIRAHALVSLGAAVFAIAGARLLGDNHPDAVSRVIQGIAAGVGFLGAGVILRGPDGMRVFHLATAASLWVTTGIGVLCGLGALLLGAAATVLALGVLVVGMRLDRNMFGKGGPEADEP